MRLTNTSKSLSLWSLSVVERARKNIIIPGSLGQKRGRKKSSSGKLASSLGFKMTDSPNGLTTSFTSSADYAAIVHEGRDANSTPPAYRHIVRWIGVKPIRLRQTSGNIRSGKGRFVRQGTGASKEQRIKSAAIAMSKSIGKRGIKAFPFMSEAMNEEFNKLPDHIAQAMVLDMEDLLFTDFQKNPQFTVTKR